MKVIGTYLGEKALDIGAQVPVWTDVVWDSTTNLSNTPNAYTTYSEPYAADGLVIDNSTDFAVPVQFVRWVLEPPNQTQTRTAAALYKVTGAAINVADWKRDRTKKLNQNPHYRQWV